jgi:hypothetical protein
MNCSFRIIGNSMPEYYRFSFSVTPEKKIFLKRIDCSENLGWPNSFFVELSNEKNESQLLEIPASPINTFESTSVPWISLSSKPPRETWKIPPLIFQCWKSHTVSPEMGEALSSFKNQKGYQHFLLDDQQCYQQLLADFGQRYADAFALLVPGAFKADFWRYCILYKYGGVYSDAKATLLRDLDEIIRPDDELVLVRDVPASCLLNAFIAAKPGHPLLKITIERCLHNIENRLYGVDPLDVTACHLLGRAFCQWKGQPDDTCILEAGKDSTTQIFKRSIDRKYIISAQGDMLIKKEYDSYYKKDVDVSFHYPILWHNNVIYYDQLIKKIEEQEKNNKQKEDTTSAPSTNTQT